MELSPQIANLVAFYFNVLVAYGFGAQSTTWSDVLKIKSAKDVSAKYPTLITPAGYAFSIWGLIFFLEAVSVCWQFTLTEGEPRSHGHGRIPFLFKEGSYYWTLTCILQCFWTFAFGWELIFISTGFMISVLYAAACTYRENLDALHQLASADMTSEGYAYFWAVFPFAVHASWLIVATLVQVNIVIVARKASSVVQVSFALISLASILLLGCVTAGSLLGSIGYAKTLSALNGTHVGSRMTLLAVLLWAARAIERFETELSRLTAGVEKKSESKTGRKSFDLIPLSRFQTIVLQRFKGVVFRCLLGAFLGNIVLFAVKYYQFTF